VKLAAAQPSNGDRETLRKRARDHGSVALLIGLAVPTDRTADPGSSPHPPAPSIIAAIQSRLLDHLGIARSANGALQGLGITNVTLFETIPFLALTADGPALEHLLSHPMVTSVTEDGTAGTQ
jgi:hypothetical protein